MRAEQELRYGENPHQKAASTSKPHPRPCVATAEQLHGKELSYNNILDLDSALNLAREFAGPAAVVVKHNNPCGAATAPKLADAFTLAWDGDPLSAFGGILAFNRTVDADTASALMDPKAKRFVECVIAPDYEPHALEGPEEVEGERPPAENRPAGHRRHGCPPYRAAGARLPPRGRRPARANPRRRRRQPRRVEVVTKRKPTEDEFMARCTSRGSSAST
jgi:phosphoribosylaminoimidazolecarboxamide formyltransferase / IMP cyclohydrolase